MYPTLMELCGLQEKPGLEGRSLVSLLKDPRGEWNHPALTTHGRNNHAVRDERWRYIRYADGSEELYDHDADPLEWKNLAGDAKLSKVKEELAASLPKVNAPDARIKPRATAFLLFTLRIAGSLASTRQIPSRVSYEKPFPGEATGISHRSELKMDWSHGHNNAVINGIGRIGFMIGGKSALWVDEQMAEVFTRKAVSFIEQQKGKPFFLYFATHDIHVPRVPHPRFTGKTTMRPGRRAGGI